jgi:hypothetical protein|tara:strand:- start:4108 stop:5136 length:1029 start_codon:yes stop_codon:yes gene_type:complete
LIQNQVELPVKVAFGVAMQGMRIRFGRSVVTVMGVVLGIAFLMAILTEQVVSEGVKDEEQMRMELGRMVGFLTADMGPVEGRTVSVVQTGGLSIKERRLLLLLEELGLAKILWTDLSDIPAEKGVSFEDLDPEDVELSGIGENARAIIVVGDGELAAEELALLRGVAHNPVLFTTRTDADHSGALVSLGRDLRQEEKEALVAEKRKSEFRNRWIVVISLVVTVIGITNAMLISVTERFREIATMKCLGGLSQFIRLLFLIEATVMGLSGAIFGTMVGIAFSLLMYCLVYDWDLVFRSLDFGILVQYLGLSLVVGVVLSVIAAIYPAHIASRMMPADALRSHI